MPLPAHLAEIEQRLAQGDTDERIVEPNDPQYDTVRTGLLESARSKEDLDAIYERYPYNTQPAEDLIAKHRFGSSERDAALEEAKTEEDLDAVYEKFDAPAQRGVETNPDYLREVQEAQSIEDLDAIYAKYGRPAPVPLDSGDGR